MLVMAHLALSLLTFKDRFIPQLLGYSPTSRDLGHLLPSISRKHSLSIPLDHERGGACTLVQHFLNLNKLEASSLMHGIQHKNDYVEKELDNGALEEKTLEHVIMGDLEAPLFLYKGCLEVQN